MPRHLLLVLLLLSWTGGARAERTVETKADIAPQDCRWLARHRARPDVAFKPGVDVRGRPVKPAEHGWRSPIALPQRLTLDLSIPLRELGSGSGSPVRDEAEVQIGRITLDRASGLLRFNGQPLSDPAQAQLRAFCRERFRNRAR